MAGIDETSDDTLLAYYTNGGVDDKTFYDLNLISFPNSYILSYQLTDLTIQNVTLLGDNNNNEYYYFPYIFGPDHSV
jgi:hypothetical protein